MADIKYEIIEDLGSISVSSKGWKKELKLISWNDNAPKYDLREWSADNTKMGKGVTLTTEELKALRDLLNKLDF